MGRPTDVGERGAQLGRLERLPWRKIILIVLSVFMVSFLPTGVFKTLTLPADERYSAAAWRDFIVLGVAQGSIYALIALGYTLVYGILRMINFAHGEVLMMGAFAAYFFSDAYEASGFLDRSPIAPLAI